MRAASGHSSNRDGHLAARLCETLVYGAVAERDAAVRYLAARCREALHLSWVGARAACAPPQCSDAAGQAQVLELEITGVGRQFLDLVENLAAQGPSTSTK